MKYLRTENWKLKTGRRAFGLVEVVIASGILVLVAGGSLALSNTVLKGTTDLADRTQALYLAVEGIELVQQIRDTNYIDEDPNTTWKSGLPEGDSVINFYGIRPKLVAGSNESVRIGVPASIEFKRTVNIVTENVGQPTERKKVKVTVTWGGGQSKLETVLTDIKRNP